MTDDSTEKPKASVETILVNYQDPEGLTRDENNFYTQIDPDDIEKRNAIHKEKLRALQAQNDSLEQDNGLRLDYAEKAYGLVQTWVGFVIVLVSAQFGLSALGYGLGREEFIAVVVSLSASVFGFWALVGRYLFPSGQQAK